MPRMLDLVCSRCGAEVDDFFVMSVPRRIIHLECEGEFEQVYRLRPKNARWSEHDSIVVFRKRDGTYSYPARNDKPTPAGSERIRIRSLAELRAFERRTGTVSHVGSYDSNGRAIDDRMPSPKTIPNEEERYKRFRDYTRGVW